MKAAGNVVAGSALTRPSGRPLYAVDVHAPCALGDTDAELLRGLHDEFAALTVIPILSGSELRCTYASL